MRTVITGAIAPVFYASKNDLTVIFLLHGARGGTLTFADAKVTSRGVASEKSKYKYFFARLLPRLHPTGSAPLLELCIKK